MNIPTVLALVIMLTIAVIASLGTTPRSTPRD